MELRTKDLELEVESLRSEKDDEERRLDGIRRAKKEKALLIKVGVSN